MQHGLLQLDDLYVHVSNIMSYVHRYFICPHQASWEVGEKWSHYCLITNILSANMFGFTVADMRIVLLPKQEFYGPNLCSVIIFSLFSGLTFLLKFIGFAG